MTRLAGHELWDEGAPYGGPRNRTRLSASGTSGVGRGVCSCLEMSPVLDSGSKRKQWHREHKDQIRAEQA